jgi:chorismate mutase
VRLRALRGATTADANDANAILEATEELVSEVLERNQLRMEDLVSCIFTCTTDLDAEFPAVAARQLGFDRVPLLCTREVPVPGSLPMVIRVLIHYYADDDHEAGHVYLGEARRLRRDLDAAQ